MLCSRHMAHSLPKVTVLIQSYNQEAYILQAYESVLNQTYPNIEIIGYDNGSSDRTQSILRETYGNNPRIQLFLNDKNESIQTASKKSLKLCNGEFLSILYGDDYYLPEKIALQMQCFLQKGEEIGVVYCPGFRLNQVTGEIWQENSLRSSGWIFKQMMQGYHTEGTIPPIAPLFRKQCFIDFPFRDELVSEGEDIFFRFALSYRFHFLETPLVVMRDHLNNTGKAILRNYPNFIHSMELMKTEPLLKKEEKKAFYRYVGRTLRNYGWQGIRVASNPGWARHRFLNAISWDFWQIFHPRTLIGIPASFVPASLLKRVNYYLSLTMNKRENVVLKTDWA